MKVSMKMIYKILDSQGRIVLPQELREIVDVQKGDILELSVHKNIIEIRKLDVVKLNDDSNESKRNTVIAVAKELDKASLLMLAKKLVEFAEKEEEFDDKNI
jgi:AbrB family transcriptional regulator (stage V sporulation protein T)